MSRALAGQLGITGGQTGESVIAAAVPFSPPRPTDAAALGGFGGEIADLVASQDQTLGLC
jgi:hypothetical protein